MNFQLLDQVRTTVEKFFREQFGKLSGLTMLWVATIMLHAATIPTYLAILGGATDSYPPVDIVLFVWAALSILLIRSAVVKDWLNALTNASGFVVQAVFLALITFV